MSKVLFVATVVKTHIMEFHVPYLKMFRDAGWETAVAARNDYEDPADCVIPCCDHYYDIPFERSPLKPGNLKAYRELKKIINSGHYDVIHCHTPVGALLARLAARKARKAGMKVIYTAHGFHFYRGAPLKSWLLYYPVEKLCARWTDTLITINKEDHDLACRKMRAGKVEYVPGVGIDVGKFANAVVDRAAKRREIGVPEDAFLLLSVGELIRRKNHAAVIHAMQRLPENVHYAVAGRGELREQLLELITELHLEKRVHLLGYRRDIPALYKAADVCVLPSFQEGLPVALMEGMAAGLPCIASRIRGSSDLLDDAGGCLVETDDAAGYARAAEKLYEVPELRRHMGAYNSEKVRKYDHSSVDERMKEIYGV